jgi:hypothetical protein
MTDHTRGLLTGTLGTFILWQVDDYTNLAWWASMLIALAVGITVTFIVALASHILEDQRNTQPDA